MDLQARIADLEEENAWLRSELGLIQHESEVCALRDGLGVSNQQARILLVLRAIKGRHASPAYIMEAVPRTQGGETARSTDSQVCHIRKKLGFDTISTSKGFGYRLSEGGREMVERCLNRVLEAA